MDLLTSWDKFTQYTKVVTLKRTSVSLECIDNQCSNAKTPLEQHMSIEHVGYCSAGNTTRILYTAWSWPPSNSWGDVHELWPDCSNEVDGIDIRRPLRSRVMTGTSQALGEGCCAVRYCTSASRRASRDRRPSSSTSQRALKEPPRRK